MTLELNPLVPKPFKTYIASIQELLLEHKSLLEKEKTDTATPTWLPTLEEFLNQKLPEIKTSVELKAAITVLRDSCKGGLNFIFGTGRTYNLLNDWLAKLPNDEVLTLTAPLFEELERQQSSVAQFINQIVDKDKLLAEKSEELDGSIYDLTAALEKIRHLNAQKTEDDAHHANEIKALERTIYEKNVIIDTLDEASAAQTAKGHIEAGKLRKKLFDEQRQITELKASVEDLSSQLENIKCDYFQLRQKYAQTAEERDSLEETLIEDQKRISELTQSNEGLIQQQKQMLARLQNSQKQLKGEQSKISHLNRTLKFSVQQQRENEEKINSLRLENGQLKDSLSKAEELNRKQQSDLSTTVDSVQLLQGQVAELQSAITEYQNANDGSAYRALRKDYDDVVAEKRLIAENLKQTQRSLQIERGKQQSLTTEFDRFKMEHRKVDNVQPAHQKGKKFTHS